MIRVCGWINANTNVLVASEVCAIPPSGTISCQSFFIVICAGQKRLPKQTKKLNINDLQKNHSSLQIGSHHFGWLVVIG